jgi:hypothetical protein
MTWFNRLLPGRGSSRFRQIVSMIVFVRVRYDRQCQLNHDGNRNPATPAQIPAVPGSKRRRQKPPFIQASMKEGGVAEKMRVLADSNEPKVALRGKSTRSHRYPMKSRLSVSFLQKLYFFEVDSCSC